MSDHQNPTHSPSAELLLGLLRPHGDDTVANWTTGGLCAKSDPDLFFPRAKQRERTTRTAKAVCSRCPVIDDCLEHALQAEEAYGIWGGTTAGERDRIRARRALRSAG